MTITDPKQAYIDFLMAKIPKAEVSGFEPPSACRESTHLTLP
jgi:hypothetical protein